MLPFYNRTRCATATTGTGTVALGLASTGYLSFAEAGVSDGATVTYMIEDHGSFELGRGVYSSGAQTLTRARIIASKVFGLAAGVAPISLSGTATLFLTSAAADIQNTGAHFSLEQFGAKNDGTTDDTGAFIAAIAKAKASGSIKRVYAPHGAGYVLSAIVDVPAGVTIYGDNFMGGELSRIKPAPGYGGVLFRSEGHSTGRILRPSLQRLYIDGSATTLTAIDMRCQEGLFQHLTIKNCFTYFMKVGGFGSGLTEQALENHILDCYFAGEVGVTEAFDGLFLDYNTADTLINRCYIQGAQNSLIRSRAYNDKISACHLYSSTGWGYYSETSADKIFNGNYVENTSKAGVLIDGGGSDVATLNATIQGNAFRNIDKGGTANGVIEIQGSDISSLSIAGNVVRRDAATAYSTPYFVYFNAITPSRAKVYGNEWQSGLITAAETNINVSGEALADLVGDDATNDGPALQAALDAANGKTIRLVPGKTYRIATQVYTRGKSWTLDARGAKIHFDANINGLIAQAEIDNLQNVSAISGANVTVANGAVFAAGDFIRVISEDLPVNARTVNSGDTFKLGEPGIVKSISGNVLTLTASLIDGAAMLTSRRIFRMPLREQIRVIGGEWYYTDGHDATPWAANMVSLYGIIGPRLDGMRITRAYGSGVLLVGTQHAVVTGLHAERLTDNTALGQFGYGLTDMGHSTKVYGLSGGSCRHLITTGALPPPALTTNEDRLHWYGGSRGLRLVGGTAKGCTSAAFDTHHSTDDVVFSGLYAENCLYAVTMRARNARVTDIEARNITDQIVYVFTELYSLGVSDGIVSEAGWANNVHIDKITGSGGKVAVLDRARDVHIGRVNASVTDWRAFQCFDVEAFLHEDISLAITDTTATDAGRGIFDCDLQTAVGFTPQVQQITGKINVVATNSSGSTTFAAIRSDASNMILRELDINFPNGSVGPMLITANGGTIQSDVGFDIAGAAETGMTLTSGSNITANVQSADGLNDALNLRLFARTPARWVSANERLTATIASGVITATGSFMVIDTEAAGAADDLDTINEGVQGDILILRSSDNARDITVKHGTGNIFCGSDRVLNNTTDKITLMNENGTTWSMLSFADNGT